MVLCVGHLGDQIHEFVGDGSRWGLAVDYVDDGPVLLGTGGALRRAFDEGALSPVFAVLYGDSYLTVDLGEVYRDFEARRPPALMCTYRNRGRWDASNASVRDGWVSRYEKGLADPAAAGMDEIDYGLSVLDRDLVLPTMPPRPSASTSPTSTRSLRPRDSSRPISVEDRFYEIGSPAGPRRARRRAASPRLRSVRLRARWMGSRAPTSPKRPRSSARSTRDDVERSPPAWPRCASGAGGCSSSGSGGRPGMRATP